MLGSFGLWASSKGMKVVTNYVGMTKTNAEYGIVSDGFKVGTETAQSYTDASDQDKDGKIVSQVPAAGNLAEYESNVDLTYGTFTFTPFGVFGFSPFGVFGFAPFNVFGFVPFTVFGFSFSVFGFVPFTVFGFSFSVFGFVPFTVFGFSFSVFGFSPFSVFGFR
jgi:hypothetical protein